MTRFVAGALSLALIGIGILHLYWGFGGFWPGHDEASLVDMVLGMPAGTPIPPFWACAFVAACLVTSALAAMVVAFRAADKWSNLFRWIPASALWFSAFVFLARGVSTYVSPLVGSAQGTAFYHLDRVLYAPICLILGLGLVYVGWFRPKRSITP